MQTGTFSKRTLVAVAMISVSAFACKEQSLRGALKIPGSTNIPPQANQNTPATTPPTLPPANPPVTPPVNPPATTTPDPSISTPPTPARVFVYAGGYAAGNNITAYSFNITNGNLTPVSSVSGGTNASYFAFDPTQQTLYSTDEPWDGSSSFVRSYSINQTTGALTPIGAGGSPVSTGGSSGCHLAVHPGGRWIGVANYNDGRVAILPIGGNKAASAPSQVYQPDTRNAHMIFFPSANHMLLPMTGPNQIVQYNFDATSGTLSNNTPASVAGSMVGGMNAEPRHVALHPTFSMLYAVNENVASITSYQIDKTSGRLSSPVNVSALPTGTTVTNKGAQVVVSPNGKFVYASNRGHNSIALFSVNQTAGATQGRPSYISNYTAGGTISTPREFAIDPTGKFMVIGNQDSNNLTVVGVNPDTGALGPVVQTINFTMPMIVSFLTFY